MPKPEIEFLILADAVEAVQGKLYMLGGGWTTWFTPNFPVQVRMGIATGLLVPWEHTNEQMRVRFFIEDADGQPIGPTGLAAEVEVGRPPGIRPGSQQRAILAVNMGFPIEKPGRYEVGAEIGEEGSSRRVHFDATVGNKPS